jgi:GT2 family glycosyltransferase
MSTRTSKTDAVVIIPTYTNTQGLRETLNCVKTLGKYRVIVVNNKPDNVLTDIPALEPTDILTEPKNEGFAKACNDGANEAKNRYSPGYFVFLNDDVLFQKDWIAECVKEMEKNEWDATVPVLEKPDGSIENVGYRVLKQGKIELLTRSAGGGPLDGITAAALVIKAETFQELDGFDETFFAYLEDVDLCLRLTEVGYSFGVTKTASVTHMGQQTSSKMSRRKATLDFKNWIKLINRHWSREEKMKYFPQIFSERMRNLSGVIKSF